ncbi:wall-associated receptor kinase 5-like protein, partial [Leptotrombidium deliense]
MDDLRNMNELREYAKRCDLICGPCVAEGRFTAVYEATKNKTNDEMIYALKKIRVILILNLTHILNELVILNKLNHENITPFIDGGIHCEHHNENYDVYNDDDDNIQNESVTSTPLYVWIQMPFYKTTLFYAIKNGETHNIEFRIKVVKQLLEAMKYLKFKNKIDHRDVKPENIFLDENNTVKLGDFGISKENFEDSWKYSTECKGTNYYMAPEVLELAFQLKKIPIAWLEKADVYSIGKTWLEMSLQYRVGETTYSCILIAFQEGKISCKIGYLLSDSEKYILALMLRRDREERETLGFVYDHVVIEDFRGCQENFKLLKKVSRRICMVEIFATLGVQVVVVTLMIT